MTMLRRLPLPKLRSPSAAASLQTPRRFAYQKATPSNSSNDDSAGHPSNPSDDPKLSPLYTPLTGRHLLEEPMLNKGAAFTFEERERFRLKHFLPHEYHRLETQLGRAEAQLRSRKDPLAKYSFLRSMKDQNQVLFYALIQKNLKECLPIIYTPTVGDAIKEFSHLFRRPDGVFLSYPHFKEGGARYLRDALTDHGALTKDDIDLVVFTDSEGILGIGDMGVGGIGIVIGKQTLYTLGAGIDPNRCLNVVLDPGTDNQHLLNDDLYLGWRHTRIRGEDYDKFVDTFMAEAAEAFPYAMLHAEDFGNANAYRLLEKFRPKYSIFNDDIQGTSAAALATLTSALKVTGSSLKDSKIVLVGAGTAGLGITVGIRNAMMKAEGLSKEEANARFWLVDRYGLIHEGQEGIRETQQEFARSKEEVAKMTSTHEKGQFNIYDTVKAVQPTVLIGTSTIARSFTKDIIEEMSKHVDRPIILPISNPTSLCEVDPQDALDWSDGRALLATGSPFPPVTHPKTGEKMKIAELNNALVFPALGLGTILSKSSRLTDGMIVAGVEALASLSPTLSDSKAPLLPDLGEVREVSIKIAAAVMLSAKEEGQSNNVGQWPEDREELERFIEAQMWKPRYRPLELVNTAVAQ